MPKRINHEEARRIAYDWHHGQDSPLYALASSGLVQDYLAVFAEILRCEEYAAATNSPYMYELHQLQRYLEDHLTPTEPGAPWPHYCAPWADAKMTKRASM